MLTRALKAASLESLVLEGEALVYVRTGLAVATLNRDTGYITDNETGLIVAYMDTTTGMVYSASASAE